MEEATEEMLMIDPAPAASMAGSAAPMARCMLTTLSERTLERLLVTVEHRTVVHPARGVDEDFGAFARHDLKNGAASVTSRRAF
jgi:hypothetical protein